MSVELYIEPFIGYRSWLLEVQRGQAKLHSYFHTTVWPVQRPFHATCTIAENLEAVRKLVPFSVADHGDTPDFKCGCGSHAFATPQPLVRLLRFDRVPFVSGEVEMWGRMIVHEHGYRAEYAKPRALYFPVNRPTAFVNRVQLAAEQYDLPLLPYPQ